MTNSKVQSQFLVSFGRRRFSTSQAKYKDSQAKYKNSQTKCNNSQGKTISEIVVQKKTVSFSIEKMRVLQITRIHLKILGVFPLNKPIIVNKPLSKLSKYSPIDCQFLHIGLIYFILLLNILTTFFIYVTDVKEFDDFSESIFWASRSVLSLALYSMFVWYKPDIVKLFGELDDIVEQSKRFCNFSIFFHKYSMFFTKAVGSLDLYLT